MGLVSHRVCGRCVSVLLFSFQRKRQLHSPSATLQGNRLFRLLGDTESKCMAIAERLLHATVAFAIDRGDALSAEGGPRFSPKALCQARTATVNAHVDIIGDLVWL